MGGSAVLVPIFGTLIPFAAVFGILYVYYTTRNRERMLLIEKGADPKLFQKIKADHKFLTLKSGLFLLGIGVGLIFASIIDSYTEMESVTAYFSMTLLFGGIALVGAYFIQKKTDEKK